MENKTEHFMSLDETDLEEINGGGFAYDVGRVLRFLVISGGGLNPFGIAEATGDWIINDAANR